MKVRTVGAPPKRGGDVLYTATSLHRITVKDPTRNLFGSVQLLPFKGMKVLLLCVLSLVIAVSLRLLPSKSL